MSGIDGGKIGPTMAEDEVTAAAKAGFVALSRMASISMRPMPPISASAEPDMTANTSEPKMLTCASRPAGGPRPCRRTGRCSARCPRHSSATDEDEHRHGDEREGIERIQVRCATRSSGRPLTRDRRDTGSRSRERREAADEQREEGEDDEEAGQDMSFQVRVVCFSSDRPRRQMAAAGRRSRRT